MKIWLEIADVINENYKSSITSESIRVRVALNRDGIQEDIGLVNQININSNHNEIPNYGMDLNDSYMA